MTIKLDLTPADLGGILVYAGDKEQFGVKVQDDASPPNALDVSHLTWTSQIRQTRESDTIFEVDVDSSDAANGNLVITIPSAVTSVLPRFWVWDLQFIPEGDSDPETYLQSKGETKPDVTRSS